MHTSVMSTKVAIFEGCACMCVNDVEMHRNCQSKFTKLII